MTTEKPLYVPARGDQAAGEFRVTVPSPQPDPPPGSDFPDDPDACPRKWALLVHPIDSSGGPNTEAQLSATVVERTRGFLRFQDIEHNEHPLITRRGVCAALYRAIAQEDLLGLGYGITALTSSDRTGRAEEGFLSVKGDAMWRRFVRDGLAVDDGHPAPYRWII